VFILIRLRQGYGGRSELADVFYSAFLLATHYQLDVREIVLEKLEKNLLKMVAGTFTFIFHASRMNINR